MKGLFPQYADLADRNYGDTWSRALFVFDTNVLLNLYRYHATTREELIQVLGQLAERVWIPHHVALEFQRNRLKVIAEQSKRFSEISRGVETAKLAFLNDLDKLHLNKRHSLINPTSLSLGLTKLVEDFLKEVYILSDRQQKLTAPDPLRARIEEIFEGRVGPSPANQSVVDDLYAEAEARFRLRIPPGYLDAEKDSDGPDEYQHGGIIYKRKYGDFLFGNNSWHMLNPRALER